MLVASDGNVARCVRFEPLGTTVRGALVQHGGRNSAPRTQAVRQRVGVGAVQLASCRLVVCSFFR